MTKKRLSQTVSVLDVAAYILANHCKNNPIAAWKMHRLAYYCQAWSLVREGVPFFREKILITPKGLMIKELCPQHFDNLYVGGSTIGNLNHLSLKQVDTIDFVMKTYGGKTLAELDELIRHESPWNNSGSGKDAENNDHFEVHLESLLQYYRKKPAPFEKHSQGSLCPFGASLTLGLRMPPFEAGKN